MSPLNLRPLVLAALVLAALLLGCAGATQMDVPASDPPAVASPSSARIVEVVGPGSTNAPETASRSAARADAGDAANAPIPFDPAVVRGRLDNGLEYYVRENSRPENRAALRLVVNAGSLMEDDDQRGLAHFVEHMAFNGTENFEKQELVDYLETIGMRFGPDINAYTSFDETVYMLEVPTDDEEIVATAFQILEDWAHGVTFEDEEVDKERGVVVEEWRLGRGAGGRIRDQQLPVMFHGSRYAERLVIGRRETLEEAPAETLRRFYRDWYRPDLMAVIAVGDFDTEQVVEQIGRHFGDLTAPQEPRSRQDAPVPDHEETLTNIATDPEATTIDVTVGYKRPPSSVETRADYRRAMVDSLYHGMMNQRLQELTQLPDPPFQFGFAASGGLGRTKSMYRLFTRVRDGGVLRGLETMLTEVERVERHGFTATELERGKRSLLRSIESAWDERDKTESGRYAGQYVGHYLEGDPVPGIEYTYRLYRDLVPTLSLDEVNARADQWITEDNRVILVSGPDKEEAGIPDQEALHATFDRVAELDVLPWVDRTRDEPLVAEIPEAGEVIVRDELTALEAWRWELSNGATIVLKPTDHKQDEVLLRGYSPGGHSLASDEDYLSASSAAGIVSEGGVGAFDQIELGKALTGKRAFAGTSIGELSESVFAAASPKDLETMFQLVYLRMVSPRRDEEAFQSMLTTMRGQLENQQASPAFWFNRRFEEVAHGDHPRRQTFMLEQVDELDLDTAMAVYQDRFADASDFLFTLVGNFDVDEIEPLVVRWLGGLPSTDRQETWRDVDAYAEEGVHTFEVYRGIEPKSQVRILFYGFADWSPQESYLAGSMAEALRIRLREVLREDLGGVYGVGVYSNLSRHPRGRYNSGVSFSADPERVPELIEATFEELRRFQAEGPSEEILGKVAEIQRRSRETALEQNRYWLSMIEGYQRGDVELDDILDIEQRIDTLSVEALRDAARSYFDPETYIQGVLYPEDADPAAEAAADQ